MAEKDEKQKSGTRPAVISLRIKDDNALYMAYMPFIADGGLFVPSTKDYNLGDEVYLLVKLLDDSDKLPIAGKVVWITPAGATGNRQQGIGVQFIGDNKDSIRNLIETRLTGQLTSKKPTHTM